MSRGTRLTDQEIKNIKLLSKKGLQRKEIEQITGRSGDSIRRAIRGDFDKKTPLEIEECRQSAAEQLGKALECAKGFIAHYNKFVEICRGEKDAQN